MRSTTERPGRLAPVLAALGTVAVVVLLAGSVIGAILLEEPWPMLGIALLYLAFGVAVAAGVLAALVQRLREIRRGEEVDARKY